MDSVLPCAPGRGDPAANGDLSGPPRSSAGAATPAEPTKHAEEVGTVAASSADRPGIPPPPERPAAPTGAEPYVPLRAADLKEAGGRPTRWIWQGYLAAGEVTLLTSLWKSGKTTLVSLLLARMAKGGMLGGFPVAAGRAVVVTEESPTLWFERSQALALADHVCWFCRPFRGKPRPEQWEALLDQIGRMHDRQPIDLVVIDPLANLAPLRTENDSAEMLNALLPLQRLTERGICDLVLHHPHKGPVVAGQAARGSGALSGFADVLIEMQGVSRHDPKDRRRRLRGYSRHEQTPPCWLMELTADGTDYVGLGESAAPDFAHGWPVLKAVLEQSTGPMTRRDILLAWPEGVPAPARLTLWKWLHRLVREGQVLCDGAGTRREPHRYRLPGMERKWQEDFIRSFMAECEASRGPGTP